ncbi:hypothetical protein [Vibrio phage V-YDF132]|nr:hypothetical protein [Vibrio phage V-YDF132]
MAYQASDIAVFLPSVVSNDDTNGGVTSLTTVESGLMNSLFPDVTSEERQNGSTVYRKMVFKPNTQAVEALFACNPVCTLFSNPDVVIGFAFGTELDTQAEAKTYDYMLMAPVLEKGNGHLRLPLANTVNMPPQDADVTYRFYRPSTKAVFTAKGYNASTDTGKMAIFMLNAELNKVQVGDLIMLGKTYDKGVGADMTTLTPRVLNYTMLSSRGTVTEDMKTYPSGALRTEVTLTFTSQDTYNVTVKGSSSVKKGYINQTTKVYHPSATVENQASLMLEIPPSVFGGTWAAGDELSVEIESGAVVLWLQRIIAAGTADSAGALNLGTSLQFTTN